MSHLKLEQDGKCHAIQAKINCKDGHSFILPAWPIVVDGFESFEFVVHKSIYADDDWVVADKGVGYAICVAPSIDEAIELAQIVLSKNGVDDYLLLVEKAKKKIAAVAALACEG